MILPDLALATDVNGSVQEHLTDLILKVSVLFLSLLSISSLMGIVDTEASIGITV